MAYVLNTQNAQAGSGLARIQQRINEIDARISDISYKTGIPFSEYLNVASSRKPAPAVKDELRTGWTFDGDSYEYKDGTDEAADNAGGVEGQVSREKTAAEPVSSEPVEQISNPESIYKRQTVETDSASVPLQKLPAGQYDGLLEEISDQYGVDSRLIRAICYVESNFRHDAVSSAGAIGLMQLMPATAKALGVTNAYDPQQNIDGGVRYIKAQLERFDGDVRKAVAAYNCGPGRVAELTDLTVSSQLSRLPKETQNYLVKIESLLRSAGAGELFDGGLG
ncbi:MAG: lytic transglycosylase domain-containing protein [Oscillospiraceae bacterium]|nr:lytic transglycosylase domain-containing protein [Oscillospiraceae bacterium]